MDPPHNSFAASTSASASTSTSTSTSVSVSVSASASAASSYLSPVQPGPQEDPQPKLPSTSFASPLAPPAELSEGEYVRRTYLHFDQTGIRGDGEVVGEEWTRGKRVVGELPWEVNSSSSMIGKDPEGERSLAAAHRAKSKGRPTSSRTSMRSSGQSQVGAALHSEGSLSNDDVSVEMLTGQGGVIALARNGTVRARSTRSPRLNPSRFSSRQPSPCPSPGPSPSTSTNHLSPDSAAAAAAAVAGGGTSGASGAIMSDPRLSASDVSLVSEVGTEEWQEQREVEQSKRRTLRSGKFGSNGMNGSSPKDDVGGNRLEEEDELGDNWRKLDRYGFFTLDWSSSHGRLSILPAAAFELVPLPNGTKSGRRVASVSKRAQKVAMEVNEAEIPRVASPGSFNNGPTSRVASSSHLQAPRSPALRSVSSGTGTDGGGDDSSANSSLISSKSSRINNLRRRAQDRARAKEQRRIDKWADMLEPGERKGGNTQFFKVKDDFVRSGKLERRVFKGVPDRWRGAAWWALMDAASPGPQHHNGVTTSEPENFSEGDGNAVEQNETAGAVDGGEDNVDSSAALQGPMRRLSLSLRRGPSTRSTAHRSQDQTGELRHRTSSLLNPSSTISARSKQRQASTPSRPTATSSETASVPGNRRTRRPKEPLAVAAQRRRQRDHQRRFHRLLTVSSPHDVQIDLDVPRTISGHIQFHTRYGLGQRSLFKVLHAFSLLCTECGYCQGMGSLAVTLLCYLAEEEAYSLLVSMHDHPQSHYLLHPVFSPGFPGLLELFDIQEALMELCIPRLKAVLDREGITPSAYATRWYITMWANVLPFETMVRIWDVLMYCGAEILPIFSVALLHALDVTVFSSPSSSSVADANGEASRVSDANGAARQVHTQPPRSRGRRSLIPFGSAAASSGPHATTTSASATTNAYGAEVDFELLLSTLNNVFVPEDDDAFLECVRLMWLDEGVRACIRRARAARAA